MKTPSLLIIYFASLLLLPRIVNAQAEFQVLFVESANHLQSKTAIKQFDFLQKDALVENKGQLTLLHRSGTVLERGTDILDLRKISDELPPSCLGTANYFIPTDDQFPKTRTSRAQDSHAALRAKTSSKPAIDIVYPRVSALENSKILPDHDLLVIWATPFEDPSKEHRYEVLLKDIYDETIFHKSTINTHLLIPYKKFSQQDKLVIVEIFSSTSPEIRSAKFGFEISQSKTQDADDLYVNTKYHYLIDGLLAEANLNKQTADLLLRQSIKESENDERFLKLYAAFLQRNPSIKPASE